MDKIHRSWNYHTATVNHPIHIQQISLFHISANKPLSCQ